MDNQLRRASDERGSVLVIFAVGIPTFILLMAFVLDAGNWYAHKRQVQNQADAAALAAGMAYGYNFPACAGTQPNAQSDAIVAAAKNFGVLNGVSDPANIHVNDDDNDPCVAHTPGDYASPDGTMWTEVALKDQIPTLFGAFGFSPTIRAKSRVAIMQMQAASHLRPFATADSRLTDCAWASANGQTVPLTPPPAEAAPQDPLTWTGAATFHLPSGTNETRSVGVDLILGEADAGGGCPGAPTSRSITYPKVGSIGLWDPDEQLNGATFYGLTLGPGAGGCNAHFVSRVGSSCTFSMSALMKFENCETPDVKVHVGATVVGMTTSDACDPDVAQTFTGSATVAPGAGSTDDGTVPVWIEFSNTWHVPLGDPTGTPMEEGGFFGGADDPLQTIQAGDDRWEGPTASFSLLQDNFVVNGDVPETLSLTLNPLRADGSTQLLRGSFANAHSLSGSIACTSPTSTITPPADEDDPVRVGCKETFSRTTATSASCTATSVDCITAGAPSGVSFDCTPNHWTSQTAVAAIPRGDPRLITVAVTPVGAAFVNDAQHAIAGFTAFYVTGWDGDSACSGTGNEPRPDDQTTFTSPGDEAIWGHFVKFVNASSAGLPGDEPCKPETVEAGAGACIATLVQ